MPPMIKTKIVVTIGPASRDDDVLAAILRQGADVLRLNFSHGSLDEHTVALQRIQAAARAANQPVAILGDLCGPKIRVDPLDGGMMPIEPGQILTIQRRQILGHDRRISTNYEALIDEVEPGHRVLIDDGDIRLEVTERLVTEVRCRCLVGGNLRDRKGVNLPDTTLSAPALTEKDRADLAWAMGKELDYVALSFVRRPEDVYELRRLLKDADAQTRVIAKIETPGAVRQIDEIIDAADGVMVARGDLGIEVDLAQVPLLQKDITRRCQLAGKPVIVATQMLESMVHAPVPTRAEASDVANAIFDMADAVMLSAETAVGRYPVEAVATINRIATDTETFLASGVAPPTPTVGVESLRVTSAVAHAASLAARDLHAELVAVWTETGSTAALLSKHRLPQPIVGLSPNPATCRRMALNYGVIPIEMTQPGEHDVMLARLDEVLLARELVTPNDLVVVVAGTHLRRPGATNSVFIHLVGREPGE